MSAIDARVLGAFAPLVDARTGVIERVEVVRLGESDPEVFMAHAEPSDTRPLSGLPAANRGAACSASFERAVVRACGESVERYCSAFCDIGGLTLATAEELEASGGRPVPPERLYPFSDAQYAAAGFPFERTRGRRLRWVEARSAATGDLVWLPASCVFVPYLFDHAVEPFTHMPISTGLAAGRDVDGCIAKGILEILERDALMIVWHNRLTTERIDVRSCAGRTDLIDTLLSAGDRAGSRWHLNLLTLDVDVPVVGAALIDESSPPLTSFGISADPDPERALLLALEEAALTRVLVNRMPAAQEEREVAPDSLTTLHDHLVAHASSPRLRDRLRFLTDRGPLRSFTEVAERFSSHASVEERVAAAGLEAIWVDVTTADVAELGFRVVRTAMPGLQPLDNDHRYRHLGGARLRSVPRALGRRPRRLANPDPHPFP